MSVEWARIKAARFASPGVLEADEGAASDYGARTNQQVPFGRMTVRPGTSVEHEKLLAVKSRVIRIPVRVKDGDLAGVNVSL